MTERANNDVYWVERSNGGRPAFDLEHALNGDQIEFWYQPKIDLREKKLVGVEAFARFFAPGGRVVHASELIANASPRSIVRLTERALVSALKTSVNLCEIGVDVRLAINVSVLGLYRIPITDLVRRYRPDGGKSMGLVFDISESEVLKYVDEIEELASQLRRCGFSVAVDDFGGSVLEAMMGRERWDAKMEATFNAIKRLRNIEFSELKLDRNLVRNCGNDPRRREICKHVIGLAHSFGSQAVAVGIEQPSELKTLRELECDIGQGYIFGRPMSEEDFLTLLWERGVRSKKKPEDAAA